MYRYKRSDWLFLLIIILAAAGWKVYLLAVNSFPFNADEAVVGLMARHILQGNIPIFFYGQAYMGSLDALFVAGLFSIIGQKIIAIRLVQVGLYLLTIITTVEIGRVGFNSTKIGLFAAILLAIPSVNTTLYTTVSLGGYGETLLIGNLILLTGIQALEGLTQVGKNNPQMASKISNQNGFRTIYLRLFEIGILCGLGLWADGLTLVYSGPVILSVFIGLFKVRKKASLKKLTGSFGSLAFGFLFGAMPWWIYAFQNGLPHLVSELSGSAVDVNSGGFLQQVGSHLINFFLLGLTAFLGLRPPWQVTWLALPLIPFILIIWGWIGYKQINNVLKNKFLPPTWWILSGVIICLSLGFILTPFGNDPSGRYFLPLIIPAALLAAQILEENVSKPVWRYFWVSGLVIFQLSGTLQCAASPLPGITTQFDPVTVIDHNNDYDLIQFLIDNREYRGYSNYWTAYPLAFESGEQLIYVPNLPYHQDFRFTMRDDRYAPYDRLVEQSSRVAYITTNHPQLDQYLRTAFNQVRITWKEKKIGNYQVFYQLSRTVRPQEIGLGVNLNTPDLVKNP